MSTALHKYRMNTQRRITDADFGEFQENASFTHIGISGLVGPYYLTVGVDDNLQWYLHALSFRYAR
jgi:hypothetical protein